MKKVDAFYWFASVFLVSFVCWFTGDDLEAQIAAEEHAKHSLQLAQREAAEQKAEFEYLAKKAERMTGFAGVTSK
jgi:hypothetical protein